MLKPVKEEMPIFRGGVRSMTIEGMIFMWKNDQPVVIRLVGVEPWCLPLFDNKKELEVAAHDFELHYDKIKQIQDPDDFLSSVEQQGVWLIGGLRKHGDRVRFWKIIENTN